MAATPLVFTHHFLRLRDPRRRHRTIYRLLDLLFIAVCAVLCGANDWQAIATFAQARLPWLQRHLPHLQQAPSHDTFERLFARLDPCVFARCFGSWMQTIGRVLGIDHIALDGKCLRGSGGSGLGPLYLVSAWATQHSLSLGQVAVDSKSNEITALPRLLELLDLHGALVTIDAMGCQKKIAAQIVTQGGDYVLAVKDNQETLADDIRESFAAAIDTDYEGLEWDEHSTEEKEHGRHEKRTYTVIHNPAGLSTAKQWQGLTTIGMCYSERTVNGTTGQEVRFFIGSRRMGAAEYGTVLRDHWRIENNLHWQLDVTFQEDASRVQEATAENFAVLRRLALTLLQRYPKKMSMANKRFTAALDTGVLETILRGC
jgi:predicted transposase YbfD/YdcC